METGLSFAPENAPLGELSAQYVLLAEVGRGGSAVVYRARDRRLQREVALKVVRVAAALSERDRTSEVARLVREARTTARLTHPNIVTVYAVHELRDGLAVAMQYVPGRSLKQLVADEGALDPARAVRIVREVADALAYAHAHGVVHRDVKPENIFIDAASGRALLADFGAAHAGEADVRVTRTGATVGTPAYMSPEQIDGGPVDARSDLYSLGLVAWEALAGRRPWEGAGLYQLLHHQKHDVLPPIAAVRPAGGPPIPLSVEYVVERLLEKRAAARWASGEVVAAQLEHPVLPSDFKVWTREHRRRVAEYAAGRGGASARAAVSAAASTELLPAGGQARWADAAPADMPGGVAGGEVSADDAPSWTRRRPSSRRWWYAGGVAATLSLAAVPALMRTHRAVDLPELAPRGVVRPPAVGVPRPRAPGSGVSGTSPAANAAEVAPHASSPAPGVAVTGEVPSAAAPATRGVVIDGSAKVPPPRAAASAAAVLPSPRPTVGAVPTASTPAAVASSAVASSAVASSAVASSAVASSAVA